MNVARSTRVFGFVVFLLFGASAFGNSRSLEITLKDQRSQPVPGAQVQLDRLDVKAQAQTAMSDSNGHASFKNLAAGKYKVSAFKNKLAGATGIEAVNTMTSVTLSMDPIVGQARSKKRKHYVWIAEETGTHIGGGRWVAVEEDAAGTGANAVDKRSGQMFTQSQSFQIRPPALPSR